MRRLPKSIRTKKTAVENQNYKIGEPVSGMKAVVSTNQGEEEKGTVVYKRKAEYRGLSLNRA
ncbi:hypothetical protein [Peribacillus kribbensis]|uniref:hypothetical protein n=1 Tax=Peribacillus kribbensis TaxID=356658 RepID=UPI00041B6651|nr:hypothetical protein [Peribacillus kribbensis]